MTLPTFTLSTTSDEVATTFAAEIQGKNVLITGTSINGIGFETARVIAKHANLVIIAGYNSERLKLSEDAIKKEVPSANIRRLVLDLSSLAAVRKAAAEVNAYPEPIHVLINNAAASFGPFRLTADKLEHQTATDHIGPFLFTKLLAPKILAAGTASYVPRVVFVSSSGHAFGTGVNFTTLGHPDPEKYNSADAYFQAKSANILTAIELSKRSKGKINAYSLHPGVIYTNIGQKEESIPVLQSIGILDSDGKPNTETLEWKTIPQGAATNVAAAFDTRFNDKPGAYLSDCNEANKDVAGHSSDPVNAAKLWTVTEEIIGEKFTF
ncbi:NAD-P-binding protein [Mycena epipterygia]|nr:NAD-P-binding protein [Mycena epipterygia]